MWTSILAILDGGLRAFNGLLDYFSRQAIKESGAVEERLKSAEVSQERQRIAYATRLEALPSDKHLILSSM